MALRSNERRTSPSSHPEAASTESRPAGAGAPESLRWPTSYRLILERRGEKVATGEPMANGEPVSDGPRADGEPVSDGPRADGEPVSDGPRADGEPVSDGLMSDGEVTIPGDRAAFDRAVLDRATAGVAAPGEQTIPGGVRIFGEWIVGEETPSLGRMHRSPTPVERSVDPEAITLSSSDPRTPPPLSSPEPPPSIRSSYRAGDVLAHRYRLVEPIGQGGMGSVWRARSLGLDLDVALKLIRRDTEVPYAGERLLKEARAAARVVHPAAVRVFDYSVTEFGDPFLVMELLTGPSLASRITEEGPMRAVQAVQLILPVIGALAVAHREGIVHRDVKPANIMLVDDGDRIIPKLIDFGIAGVAATGWSRKLTAHGMLLGSPIYMAPEQVRGGGGDPDERTDIWGVCTVLFELMSGARPFSGQNSATIILEILYARLPRPEPLTADRRLWSIIERGLSKAPEDRWPTMAALGQALARWAIANGAEHDVTGASLAVHWRPRPSKG